MFVISDWYHSPCLSWDPPKEDDSGRVALLGRGATFWFRSGRLSFPPAPPPDITLPEPLPGGLQG